MWNATIGVPLAILGAIAFALIYWFGRPQRPRQGRRTPTVRDSGERIEPTFDGRASSGDPQQGELEVGVRTEPKDAVSRPLPGVRDGQSIQRIVTLYVAARQAGAFHGPDLVVAAEKAGLEFGDKGIFHRLVVGKPEVGPVFSMADMYQPGHFDMREIEQLRTNGITFFMTLPGPLPALDAWEAMLPTAQRMAELLDGVVLDEERNALGRQRIAHLRDELRTWDRKRDSDKIHLR
jgi:cell division protein ZipA